MQAANVADVIIVGAGISGLSLAYYLEKLGLKVVIFEKETEVGGVIRTISVQDQILDIGPQSFLSDPEIMKLVDELKIRDQILWPNTSCKKRFLARPSTYSGIEAFPSKLSQLFASKIFSIKDSITLFKEIFTKHKKVSVEDISIYDILAERFGKVLTENVLSAPFIGIWACSVKDLSARSAAPDIFNAYLHGKSIISSLLKTARKKKYLNAKSICNLKSGLHVLTSTLASRIQGPIIKDIHLSQLAYDDNSWKFVTTDRTYQARHIVFAVPSYEITSYVKVASGVAKDTQKYLQLESKLDNISYSPIGILQVLIPRSELADKQKGFGFLLSPYDTKGLLGGIFTSSIFPDKFNDEQALVTCFCGGSIHPKLANVTDPKIEKELLLQIKSVLEVKSCSVIHKTTWENAIPKYSVGHFSFEDTIREFEESHKRLSIHSNITKGISIPSRIKQSMILAAHIRNNLYR